MSNWITDAQVQAASLCKVNQAKMLKLVEEKNLEILLQQEAQNREFTELIYTFRRRQTELD